MPMPMPIPRFPRFPMRTPSSPCALPRPFLRTGEAASFKPGLKSKLS
eukprot:CAMPEP_0173319410 /NCGR_PEP_ID=MMETSP1143-20121109/28210_1 /TAXON_ID=483371 /ORGANISM="non described non described, Strain CCMP2298" /LENGTH=46 /DNA_ID= /DNA_START= /DNA_END= /DNA_ORIENTATION=